MGNLFTHAILSSFALLSWTLWTMRSILQPAWLIVCNGSAAPMSAEYWDQQFCRKAKNCCYTVGMALFSPGRGFYASPQNRQLCAGDIWYLGSSTSQTNSIILQLVDSLLIPLMLWYHTILHNSTPFHLPIYSSVTQLWTPASGPVLS